MKLTQDEAELIRDGRDTVSAVLQVSDRLINENVRLLSLVSVETPEVLIRARLELEGQRKLLAALRRALGVV
jgi:hypothetical protein